MTAETWYLTQNVSKLSKKLGKLSGWRKEVAKLLLETDEEATAKSLIAEIVKTTESPNSLISEVLDLLPKRIQGKAKILATHLSKQMKFSDDGRVIYPDGSFGSPLIDILKYFCSPKSGLVRVKAPFDVRKMTEYLSETNAPMSATTKSNNDWIAV